MSDEALNKHLDWLDKCAEEQADEPQWDSIANEWTNVVHDKKPSLADFGVSDFSCTEEYQHWAQTNFKKLEAEIEALRKLAHEYITAYGKLAFGDALLTGED